MQRFVTDHIHIRAKIIIKYILKKVIFSLLLKSKGYYSQWNKNVEDISSINLSALITVFNSCPLKH